MTRLFRSKSCSLGRVNSPAILNSSPPRKASLYEEEETEDETQDEDEEEEEEEEESQGYFGDDDSTDLNNAVTTPFMTPESRQHKRVNRHRRHRQHHQFQILGVVAAALRKSLVTCSVERDDVAANMDIGSPTDVRHLSHVTFDRFNGSFLGLPVELLPVVPRRVPSASASVFGVSAQSMQCSYDTRGNSIPTILLKMQHRLYSEGGLQAEGIFRINAENGQEENVRSQLNEGIVLHGIDVHCLAGLIKAWFRELPTGVLDSLTPEQVMHCNTEEECVDLVNLLPATEAALLDWAITLMADVVQHERQNKMNARNIAMVFAPNMTQMADPLTALIHAVQVMNFLKTLIEKSLREREPTAKGHSVLICADSESHKVDDHSSSSPGEVLNNQERDDCSYQRNATRNLSWSATLDRLESDTEEKFWSLKSKSDVGEKHETHSSRTLPVVHKRRTSENSFKDGYDSEEVEGILDRLSLRKGVRKLRRHPVFKLSKPVKKSGVASIVNTRGGDREAWA